MGQGPQDGKRVSAASGKWFFKKPPGRRWERWVTVNLGNVLEVLGWANRVGLEYQRVCQGREN